MHTHMYVRAAAVQGWLDLGIDDTPGGGELADRHHRAAVRIALVLDELEAIAGRLTEPTGYVDDGLVEEAEAFATALEAAVVSGAAAE